VRNLRKEQRGAVAVEFVVAIVPVFTVFFTIAQLAALASASLMVRHAAFVAARAEAVVHPQMNDSGSENDVTSAANLALAMVPGVKTVVSATAAAQTQGMQSTTVTVLYPCTVPLGGLIACGPARMHMMTATSSFPNQGAYVQTVWSL
jgi:Flp pilus assembly protein TadG